MSQVATSAAPTTNAATQAATAATPNPAKIMIVKERLDGDKKMYDGIVDGEIIGTSKHWDYFEFHKRRGDIVSLEKLNIGKFVYINADGVTDDAKTKSIEGVTVRANLNKAITLAQNPKPVTRGFNNQTHAQAQENGRMGASARLKNAGVTISQAGERPNASGRAGSPTGKPSAATGTTTQSRQSRRQSTQASSDKPAASTMRSGPSPEQAREYGRLGAMKAAQLRAERAAASGTSNVTPIRTPGKPGRPRKVHSERATA